MNIKLIIILIIVRKNVRNTININYNISNINKDISIGNNINL